MMKRLMVCLIAVSFLCNSYGTSLTVSNNVSGSWTVDTIIVEGNIQVPSGEQLTISPGTLILFESYFRLDVSGSIHAIGNIDDSICFTVSDTTNFYVQTQGRGGWSGIRFRQLNPEEDSSIFRYCRFEFSKATKDSLNSFGGAMLVEGFNNIDISNCLFYNNYSYYSGGAIYLNDSDARIKNCKFLANYAGNVAGIIYGYGGGICSISGSPVITRCGFYANKSTGVGGGASFDGSNPLFEHNIMKGNYSGLGGALGILRCAPEHTINNLLISDNEAAFFGGGICCIRSFPVFSNITLADNISIYGGAYYCNDSAAPSMYNSIMWGNSGQGISVYIWDVRSAPNFFYCNIEGDTSNFEGSGAQQGYHGIYLNNINQNPYFITSGDYPHMLLQSSECIDMGTPDAGFLNLPENDLRDIDRIIDGRIDMGAYEFDGTTSSKQDTLNVIKLLVYPNPFASEVIISIPASVKLNVNSALSSNSYVKVYDQCGRLVRAIKIFKGMQAITWNGLDSKNHVVPSGSYLIVYEDERGKYYSQIIKQ